MVHGETEAEDIRRGISKLGELIAGVKTNYVVKRRGSLKTITYPLTFLLAHVSAGTRAVAITTDRLDTYIAARMKHGAQAIPPTSGIEATEGPGRL